jgi:hypothetical protein
LQNGDSAKALVTSRMQDLYAILQDAEEDLLNSIDEEVQNKGILISVNRADFKNRQDAQESIV